MSHNRYTALMVLGLSAAMLLLAGPVLAALGEKADMGPANQKALFAVRLPPTLRNGYTIQEFRSDAVTVREYIASDGIVFAIAWNGLTHPDLAPLLGVHAEAYGEALRQTPPKRGSRHLHVKTDQVIVEKWGNMRNLQGRAYVPALLPPGVNPDAIR